MLQKLKLPEEVHEQLEDVLSYIEEGEVDDAVDIIDALAEEFPDSYEVALHRVHVYRSLGIYNDLILPLVESCHAVDPTDLEVWVILIEELAELGFFGLAEMELELLQSSTTSLSNDICPEKFIKSVREAALYERSDFFGDGTEAAKNYLLLNLAEKALYFRDFTTAERYCKDLSTQAATSVHTWTINAKYYFLTGELTHAIHSATNAIKISPTQGEAYYILTFAELLSGKEPETFPLVSNTLLDSGISYQAYHLLLSKQYDKIISLYEKNSDIVSSHPDAARFFECVAFVLHSRNEVQRANSLWQFANTIEPEGSLIAQLHLHTTDSSNPEKPFLFFGPSEFPHFFSSTLEQIFSGKIELSDCELTPAQREVLPFIYQIVLSCGDAELVRLTSSMIVHHAKELSGFSEMISSSMIAFSSGTRLSGATRAFVAQLLPVFGKDSVTHIFCKGRKVPLLNDRLDSSSINPFKEDTDEYFYYEVLLENMNEESMNELEDMCHSIFEKTANNPDIGVEYARTLITLGKFNHADSIIKELFKNHSGSIAVMLLYYEVHLPQKLSEARKIIAEYSDVKLDPIAFREYQLLKSSVSLLDASEEAALIELDALELLLPVYGVFCRFKRESILAKKENALSH